MQKRPVGQREKESALEHLISAVNGHIRWCAEKGETNDKLVVGTIHAARVHKNGQLE